MLRDHGKTGPRGPCLDPSLRLCAPRTRHEVRVSKSGGDQSFLNTVLFRACVEVEVRRSGSAHFCRWVLYSTRTRKKNRSSIPQDATRLYRLSDFPWLFLPAGVCRLLRYCVTLLAVPGAPGASLPKLDHGKIGQQGSSAATEARLGSGVNHRGLPGKTVSIEWVRKFALYLRQLVCIQVRGTSI